MEISEVNLKEWMEVEEPEPEREEVNYVKWEEEGTTVEGKLTDLFEGKDAKFAKVDTGEELKTMFSTPAILESKLQGHIGQTVKIIYVGKVEFKSGRKGKDFRVFAKKEEG